jgi:hypothetical protein
MNTLARMEIAVSVLAVSIVAASCGTAGTQSASGNPSSATGTPGNATQEGVATGDGTSASAGGGGSAGNGGNATGNSAGSTSPTAIPSTPASSDSGTSTAGNQVNLGPLWSGKLPVQFGNLVRPLSKTLPFDLFNDSQETISILAMNTTDAAFIASQNCVGVALQPHAFCAFSITFKPTRNGAFQADLNINVTGNPDKTIDALSLSGSAGPGIGTLPSDEATDGNSTAPASASPSPAGSGTPS